VLSSVTEEEIKLGVAKKERILRMLDGERSGEKFSSCTRTCITWDQMDAVDVQLPDAHLDPDLMVKLGESQYTVLGFEGVRSAFDVGIECEPFGAKTNMGGRESNVYVTESAFEDPDSFRVPPGLFELGRFPVHFNALSTLSEKYREIVPIYSLLLAPLTLSGNLFGVDKVMRWALKDPGLLEEMLERVSDVVADYGNRLLELGADALSMGDPTASTNLISPRTFKKFVLPNYRRLSKKIKGRVVIHICGDTTPILDAIPESGFCAFSFEGPSVKVKDAKRMIGDRMALLGNIPTVEILMHGTVEDVKRATLEAIEDGIDSVEPACALPFQTPAKNARAIAEAVREHNKETGFWFENEKGER